MLSRIATSRGDVTTLFISPARVVPTSRPLGLATRFMRKTLKGIQQQGLNTS